MVGFFRDNVLLKTCNFLTGQRDDLFAISELARSTDQFRECLHVSYYNEVQEMANSSLTRAFFYQKCNEFGWFFTSGANSRPFGDKINLIYYIALCSDVFGMKNNISSFQNKIEKTNQMYGGLNPDVTKIFFTQGELDLWKLVGQTAEGGAVIIPGKWICI